MGCASAWERLEGGAPDPACCRVAEDTVFGRPVSTFKEALSARVHCAGRRPGGAPVACSPNDALLVEYVGVVAPAVANGAAAVLEGAGRTYVQS